MAPSTSRLERKTRPSGKARPRTRARQQQQQQQQPQQHVQSQQQQSKQSKQEHTQHQPKQQQAPARRSQQPRVLFAASECVPFVKTGGLADVAGSLPAQLARLGVHMAVVLPKYSDIPAEFAASMERIAEFYVPLSWRYEYCGVEKLVYEGITYYFLDNEHYFKRSGLYGQFDDGERFAFFSKAVCEAIHYVPELHVNIIHCNDWQTALIPVFLHEFYHEIPHMSAIRTVVSIHNIKFQGQMTDQMIGDVLGLASKPDAVRQLHCCDHAINFLQAGLCYADRILTVSPTYANEIQIPFYGEGLDWLIRRRACITRGILNGIDIHAWDPRHDTFIPRTYSPQTLERKAYCKVRLQEELHLTCDPTAALIVMVGRLTDQKGLGLVRYAMNDLMHRHVQIAVLGNGDANHEEAFRYFAATYPGRVSTTLAFNNALSHRMYAGADMFLMPSVFEPCGLSQMIAMRYGAVCIVRETGGLRDTVVPYNKFTHEGLGFSFANINAGEMVDAVDRALELYTSDADAWHTLQQRVMKVDFSWKTQARNYVEVYKQLQ